MSVTLSRTMSDADFWSSILGSTNFGYEWWIGVKYLDGASWDKPGSVRLAIENPYGGKTIIKTLTLSDLETAYNAVASNPAWVGIDIEDMDEDSVDMVLQYAMLGDIVYG